MVMYLPQQLQAKGTKELWQNKQLSISSLEFAHSVRAADHLSVSDFCSKQHG